MSTYNQQISLDEAIDLTTRYRANRPLNFPVCETFDVSAVNDLLSVSGCKFLRIYYGMKENLEAIAVLVAADETGQDILPSTENDATTGDNPLILEDGIRCPPDCPPASPLNSN
jgi:hypothetical protein